MRALRELHVKRYATDLKPGEAKRIGRMGRELAFLRNSRLSTLFWKFDGLGRFGILEYSSEYLMLDHTRDISLGVYRDISFLCVSIM